MKSEPIEMSAVSSTSPICQRCGKTATNENNGSGELTVYAVMCNNVPVLICKRCFEEEVKK